MDKGRPIDCNVCLKEFDNTCQFLKHVSHSKGCLKGHDPKVIEKLKRESRLRSKRNWARRNKPLKAPKAPREKARKSTYVPVDERNGAKNRP